MRAEFATFSKAGRNKENQDSVFAGTVGDRYLIAIADGMGGRPGGNIASRLAIDTVAQELEQGVSLDPNKLLSEISSKLRDAETSDLEGMGTTLTFLILNGQQGSFFHVGDTRLYLLRGNGLKTLTKDQTEVQKLIDEGVLSKARADRYRRKNILISVITAKDTHALQSGTLELKPGDRLILSTDGFHELVSKKEIRDASLAAPSIDQFKADLANLVEAKKIKDDYSFVISEIY